MLPLCMAFHELDLIPVLRRLDSGGGGGSGSEAKGDLHCSASSSACCVGLERTKERRSLPRRRRFRVEFLADSSVFS